MLRALANYGRRYREVKGHELPPMGYQEISVRWVVPLDSKGRLTGDLIPLFHTDDNGRKKPGARLYAPSIGRSSQVNPRLLCDTAEYALAVPRLKVGKSAQKKTHSAHQAFIELVRACYEGTKESSIKAVLTFLEDGRWKSRLPENIEHKTIVAFRVGDTYPMLLESVQQFWLSHLENVFARKSKRTGQCMVCGEDKPLSKNLEFQVDGPPGSEKASLVSRNETAFTSHGLRDLYGSPICFACSMQFSDGFNAIRNSKSNTFLRGETLYMFWTDDVRSADEIISPFEGDVDPARVMNMLKSIGRKPVNELGNLNGNRFHAVSIIGNRQRLAFRSTYQDSIDNVKANLARWFESVKYTAKDGTTRYYGLFPLLSSACRRPEDIPAKLYDEFWKVAFEGMSPPRNLLFNVVDRIRASVGEKGGPLTRPRLLLLTMLLKDHFGKEGQTLEQTLNNHLAYHCGRLFAVIERIQTRAGRELNATVVERYFRSAMSMPATVFPGLVATAQAHLSKIRKGNGQMGLYIYLEKALGEVMAEFTEPFPKTLSITEQGVFALGYSHMKQSFFEKEEPNGEVVAETDGLDVFHK